ncbi:MAG: M48 family metalloprotease, partial [Caulobacteraceae bacterium]
HAQRQGLQGGEIKHDLADSEAMPGAALILLVSVACAGLAASAYLRWANVRADAFSLAHAREPGGLAAVIEREWDHASVDPSFPERALFYTHPPLKPRLQRIAAWEAAQQARSGSR